VLFVCLGNICRSPMAEGAFRAQAQERGLVCLIDSSGMASYHLGEAPDPRAIVVAERNGVNISGQSARQIERDDFNRFSYIVALDKANLEGLRAKAPREGTARLVMLMDAVEGRRGEPVPDPYYGEMEAFEAAWDMINLGVAAWVDRLVCEAEALRA
jgi:protein-tyrosine phosphatase